MKIPLPCKFGELSDCDGKLLPLCGVHWFDWMSGRQYTYFFETGDQWHPYTFYETRQEQQPFSMEIPDDLLSDGLIEEKGYPLRGAGKVLGVDYRDGKLYVTFIITSNYYEHIRVECDSNGYYIPGGNIIFPPSWDTEERREHAVLKSRRFYTNRPSEQ